MKQALRIKMREKRKSLSPTLYAKKSFEIQEKLQALPKWREAGRILVYVSNPEEVDTHVLIQNALEKNRKVFVPKATGKTLAICPLYDWENLKPGNFGILEPCETLEEAYPESMDLIIVPGIAFDSRGNRIGYGGGFYDKLLKRTRGFKVGLAFSEQMQEELPIESHDVPLDLIITDESIIYPTARSTS